MFRKVLIAIANMIQIIKLKFTLFFGYQRDSALGTGKLDIDASCRKISRITAHSVGREGGYTPMYNWTL